MKKHITLHDCMLLCWLLLLTQPAMASAEEKERENGQPVSLGQLVATLAAIALFFKLLPAGKARKTKKQVAAPAAKSALELVLEQMTDLQTIAPHTLAGGKLVQSTENEDVFLFVTKIQKDVIRQEERAKLIAAQNRKWRMLVYAGATLLLMILLVSACNANAADIPDGVCCLLLFVLFYGLKENGNNRAAYPPHAEVVRL